MNLLALAAPAALCAQVPAPAPAPTATPAPSVAPAPKATSPTDAPSPAVVAPPAPAAGSYFSRSTSGIGWSQGALWEVQQGQSGWLGIGLSCEQCSISRVTSSRSSWSFRAPPVVLWVDAEGPAYRAGMRSGDTLTSVDGYDLLSPEGGRQFARIQPGQTVTLAYRRAGTERTVRMTAVLRPEVRNDAEARELMEHYRVQQDSQLQTARRQLIEAQQELQTVNRALEQGNRAALDSTRQKLLQAERALRALQGDERDRYRGLASAYGFTASRNQELLSQLAEARALAGRVTTVPLRYSGRLGDLVNVEARGPGAVNVSEVADSLIVVTAGSYVVRIARRAPGESGRVVLVRGLVMTDEGDALEGVRGTIIRGRAAQDLGVATALRVQSVQPGSQASAIGVRRGDYVIELNGHAVTRASVRSNVETARTAVVVRSGQRVELTARDRR